MNKKDLLRIIELVVRKEVKKQVNEIFISEKKSSQDTSLKSLSEKTLKKTQPKTESKVEYTKNSALNDVLNETVGLSQGGNEGDDWDTLGGGVFDSSRAAELLGYGDTLKAGGDKQTQREVAAVQTLKQAGVSSEQVPESLVNALTRDYSDLMKHDKMKGKK